MKKFFKENIKNLCLKVEKFPWTHQLSYEFFLAQTFYYVSHSTRLLALAAGRLPINEEKWFSRFVEHIKEESAHELLALRDLRALGKQITDYKMLAPTAAFFQSQYYRIEHEDPTALLGYILALEGISVEKMGLIYKDLCNAFGKEACSFIKVHAEEDISHLEKAFYLIAQLDERRINIIRDNFIHSCDLYAALLRASTEAGKKMELMNKRKINPNYASSTYLESTQ